MEKPKILYKYRDVGEYTENIFTDKTIWLSKPENLNDPFECSIAKYTDRAKEKMVKKYKELQVCNFAVNGALHMKDNKPYFGLKGKALKSFLKRLGSKSWERRYQMINEIVYENMGTRFSNPNHLIKSLDERLHGTGIFSLSETDTNQLMWAHYAGESRGLAIGFEVIEGSMLADEKHCIAVNYQDELPEFKADELMSDMHMSFGKEGAKIAVQVPFNDPTFRACVSTKPTDWAYEKEWRYIEETDGLHPFPGKLAEITFGLRCSEDDRKKYVKLIQENFNYPVHFFEIVKKANTNQIEKREVLSCG